MEAGRKSLGHKPSDLEQCIMDNTALFMCIQTQSKAAWGLMMNIMSALRDHDLEIIDHRSWHPRGIATTLVNEVYVRDRKNLEEEALQSRMDEVKAALEKTINQPDDSKVKVTRWFPGVINEIIEEVQENVETTKQINKATIEERLLSEATEALERKEKIQTSATENKSLHDLVNEVTVPEASLLADVGVTTTVAKRRTRKKTRSTPVFGGSLFGEETGHHAPPSNLVVPPVAKDDAKVVKGKLPSKTGPSGHTADLVFNGHTYHVRLSDFAIKEIRDHYSGATPYKRAVPLSGVTLASADTPVVNMLQGFVRQQDRALSRISESDEHEAHA
eukprot:CAMPEP_0116572062 /NCGR_PEP_ID=MMETSP0397-20121206/17958_1 /TAXON_ID=216820 /ORGANISM="Cyclophora tenuis, Strain ECT3854" /LENGTH=331 /DNA_ID=CAMNT_0004100331 /DNA_START=483 /DNA_END=1478 /DNA_ORIENTATION=-